MIITMLVYFYLFVFQYFKFNSVFVILLISSANIQLFHSPPPYKPIPFLPVQSVWRSWFLYHFPMAAFVWAKSTDDTRSFHFFDMIKHSIFCDIT